MQLTELLDLHEASATTGEGIPCRDNDAELWFADTPEGVEFAKALCGTCPARLGLPLGCPPPARAVGRLGRRALRPGRDRRPQAPPWPTPQDRGRRVAPSHADRPHGRHRTAPPMNQTFKETTMYTQRMHADPSHHAPATRPRDAAPGAGRGGARADAGHHPRHRAMRPALDERTAPDPASGAVLVPPRPPPVPAPGAAARGARLLACRRGDRAGYPEAMVSLTIAQDPAADRVLSEDPFALLVGMLLDQQFPMERAFAGPAKVLERFGTLDPGAVADGRPRGLRRPVRHPAGRPPLRPLDGRADPGAGRRRARRLRR